MGSKPSRTKEKAVATAVGTFLVAAKTAKEEEDMSNEEEGSEEDGNEEGGSNQVEDSNTEEDDTESNESDEEYNRFPESMAEKREKINREAVENMSFLMSNSKKRHKGLLTDEQKQAIAKALKAFYRIKNEPLNMSKEARSYIAKTAIEYNTTETVCQYSKEFFEKKNSGEVCTTLRLLTKYLLNVSDVSSYACRIIMKQKTFLRSLKKKIKQWQKPSLCDKMEADEKALLKATLGIFHNLSVQEDIAPKLKDENCFELIKPFLKVTDDSLRLSALAITASIADENQSDSLSAEQDVIEFLINNFRSAVTNENKRSCTGEWSSRELASLIRKMCRNDHNLVKLEAGGVIDLLLELILHEGVQVEEKREAVGALLALSFDDAIAETMANSRNPDVVTLLYNLMESDDEDIEVQDMSHRTLWTIRDELVNSDESDFQEIGHKMFDIIHQDDDPAPKGHDDDKSDKGGHIMISYNRCHRDLAMQISEEIEKSGYKVWIDVVNMRGSTTDAMASAVENADIVLVCFSPQYKDSRNCRSEAEYAHVKKKHILYLKMESGYEPDGWLGLYLGANLFYDFGGKYDFKKKFDELMKAIRKHYK